MIKFGGIGITSPNPAGGHRLALGGGRITLPGWLFYPFVALLSGWVFVYISGLFPYLGYKSGGLISSPSGIGRVQYGVGDNDQLQTHRMFLVGGQTAIVDYDVTVRKGQLSVSLHPGMMAIGPALLQQGIATTGAGRIAVKVPSTGLYTLTFRPTYRLNSGTMQTDVSYTLWWGGLF
jgi:hypothetical protein